MRLECPTRRRDVFSAVENGMQSTYDAFKLQAHEPYCSIRLGQAMMRFLPIIQELCNRHDEYSLRFAYMLLITMQGMTHTALRSLGSRVVGRAAL